MYTFTGSVRQFVYLSNSCTYRNVSGVVQIIAYYHVVVFAIIFYHITDFGEILTDYTCNGDLKSADRFES